MYYYYAQLNEKNICSLVLRRDTQYTVVPDNMVYLGTETQDVVGKRYDRETQTWEEVVTRYYAVLNDVNIITGIFETEAQHIGDSFMEITEDIYNIVSAGMVYRDGKFITMNESLYRMLFELIAKM